MHLEAVRRLVVAIAILLSMAPAAIAQVADPARTPSAPPPATTGVTQAAPPQQPPPAFRPAELVSPSRKLSMPNDM